jgi:hypothetical protein
MSNQMQTSTTGSPVRISIRYNQTQKCARSGEKCGIRNPTERASRKRSTRTDSRGKLGFGCDLGRVGNPQRAFLSISISYSAFLIKIVGAARNLAARFRCSARYLSSQSCQSISTVILANILARILARTLAGLLAKTPINLRAQDESATENDCNAERHPALNTSKMVSICDKNHDDRRAMVVNRHIFCQA